MKTRETSLRQHLQSLLPMEGKMSLPVLSQADIQAAGYWEELLCIYKKLGGLLLEPPLKFGPWDYASPGRLVELDDEQHFNRYRAFTLTAGLYDAPLPFNAVVYRHWCLQYEELCVRKASHGGYWSNRSTRAQFGAGSAPGDFSGGGSPRWKQRAWYDYLKDLYGMIYDIPVLRLSIYEDVEGRMLGEWLKRGEVPGRSCIPGFLMQRCTK